MIVMRPSLSFAGGFFSDLSSATEYTKRNSMVQHRAIKNTPEHIAFGMAYMHFPLAKLEDGVKATLPLAAELAMCIACATIIDPQSRDCVPENLLNGKAAHQKPDPAKCYTFPCLHVIHKSCIGPYSATVTEKSPLLSSAYEARIAIFLPMSHQQANKTSTATLLTNTNISGYPLLNVTALTASHLGTLGD
jgi:hypothetical protein